MEAECRLCGNRAHPMFSAKVMNRYDVTYFLCDECGLLQTERPYWLDQAYTYALNSADTGLISRPIQQSRFIAAVLLSFFNPHGRFVDYGGGYGVLTRIMRDYGFDFYTCDPYAKNIMSRGFEYDGTGPVELVTSLETFEHLAEPAKDIQRMLQISNNLIFSTELLPEKVPSPNGWWYYGLEHGQHIAFYSRKTLNYLARTHELTYYPFGHLHILSEKKLSTLKLRIIERMPPMILDSWVSRQMKSRTIPDMKSAIERMRVEQIK